MNLNKDIYRNIWQQYNLTKSEKLYERIRTQLINTEMFKWYESLLYIPIAQCERLEDKMSTLTLVNSSV